MSETETLTVDIEPPPPPVGDLVEALARAQYQFEQPKKSRTAEIRSDKGNYSYTYADLADIVAATIPVLAGEGIAVTQDPQVDLEGGFVTITTTLRHVEQSLTFGPLSVPIGKRDVQGIGSAITYARRYQLSAALGIAAEADDDGAAAMQPYDEPVYEPVPATQHAPKPTRLAKRAKPRRIKATRIEAIRELAERKAVSSSELLDWAGRHGYATLEELDTPGSNELLRHLNDLPDDAGSTMDDGGTTAAASSVGTRNDAASAESAGDRSDAVEGGGVVAGAPGSDDGGGYA